jgi:hypothetical protein
MRRQERRDRRLHRRERRVDSLLLPQRGPPAIQTVDDVRVSRDGPAGRPILLLAGRLHARSDLQRLRVPGCVAVRMRRRSHARPSRSLHLVHGRRRSPGRHAAVLLLSLEVRLRRRRRVLRLLAWRYRRQLHRVGHAATARSDAHLRRAAGRHDAVDHLLLPRRVKRRLQDILRSRNLASPLVVLRRLIRVVYATIDDAWRTRGWVFDPRCSTAHAARGDFCLPTIHQILSRVSPGSSRRRSFTSLVTTSARSLRATSTTEASMTSEVEARSHSTPAASARTRSRAGTWVVGPLISARSGARRAAHARLGPARPREPRDVRPPSGPPE